MKRDSQSIVPPCPSPLARAPRVPGPGGPRDRLTLAPPALQGALVALVSRDTAHLALDDAQRLSHFPASPLATLSWYHGLDAGLVDARGWHAFGARVVLSGSQAHPTVGWAPTTGRGYMACFAPDVAQQLFGVDPAAIQDRFVPAQTVMGPEWAPFFDALLGAADDAAVMAVLNDVLGERWRIVRGRTPGRPSLRQFGRHWVEQLAWRAHEWRRTAGTRQVERRVKAFSGRSLRQWQALTRTEGLFFAARERYEQGRGLDWAALAQDEHFADQAHMSRAAKHITGFAPTEFTQRFIEDESFWIYRLWV